MADRSWRHAQFGGRQLETQAARRGFKRTQFGQRGKLPHPSSLDEPNSSVTKIFDVASLVRIRPQLLVSISDWDRFTCWL
jgi:hypothetical protein